MRRERVVFWRRTDPSPFQRSLLRELFFRRDRETEIPSLSEILAQLEEGEILLLRKNMEADGVDLYYYEIPADTKKEEWEDFSSFLAGNASFYDAVSAYPKEEWGRILKIID